MRSAKASMNSKNIESLENSLQDFSKLEELNLPDGSLLNIVMGIEENVSAVKTAYSKMETCNGWQ